MPAIHHHLKTIARYIAFVLCLFTCSLAATSQTTLVTGDVAFLGYITTDDNVDGTTQNDEFSFVLLRDIQAGTTISFTDFGWTDGNAYQTANPCGPNTGAISDGIILWTATSNMTCGTEVRVRCKFSPSASVGTITPTQATSSNPAAYISLSNGGDQLFAYQGSHASPSFIAGISINKTWDAALTNCFFSSNSSRLPAALASANAEITGGLNAKYNCTVINDLVANLRTAINNNANWNKDNTFTVPIPGAFALPVNCAIHCVQPPVITLDPVSQSICTGSGVTFTVAADYATSYQWQEFNLGVWTDLNNTGVYSGVATTMLSISNVAGLDGRQYRAVATGVDPPPAISNAATLTVLASIGGSIASDATVCIGANGTLTLSGHTGAVVQWEFSTNGGGSWTPIANTTTSQPYNNISQTTIYRALVQNGACAAVYSATATITVVGLPTVTISGGGGTHCQGSTVTLTANASAGVTYAWNTGAATPTLDVTTAGVYTVTVTNSTGCSAAASTEIYIADYVFTGTVDATAPTQNARLFRDGVVNTCATPKTPVAPVAGTFFYRSHTVANPQSAPVCATVRLFAQNSPSNSNLMVAAYTGSFNPANIHENYAGDAGLSSGIPASVTSFTTTIPANTTMVIVVHETNSGHSGSGNYVVTVDIPRAPAAITTIPGTTVCPGTPLTLTASAANTYAWTPGGATTQAINAAPTVNTTYDVTLGYGNFGCTATASQLITINPPPAFTTQPANAAICDGGNTTFTVAVTGTPPFTYQWQIDQGAGFVNVTDVPPFSGSATATLNVNGANGTYNGAIFRVLIGSGCGNATSNTAILTVNPLPTINVAPTGQCAPVVLTASGNANTYTWSPATGLSATTGATVTASPTQNTTYIVTGTITATGCQNSASVNVLGTPLTPLINPAAPVVCEGTITQLSIPATYATFTSTGTITVPGTGTGTSTGAPANPYPSSVMVSGLPTTGVTVKSVTINGVTHTFPDDMDILLQSPTSTNVILMSDAGLGDDISNFNYTFDDAAPALMNDASINASGTYRPSNFGTGDNWPAPGPGTVNQTNPTLSSFTGNPNGTWGLYVTDDAGVDIGSITSWSITFKVATATWTPVTGLFTDAAATVAYTAGTFTDTVYANPASTTTYTVTSALGSCTAPTATVTVTVNPRPTITVGPNNQCGPVTLTATGNSNTYSWSPAAGLSATTGATVTANPVVNTTYTVTGTITATGCTNTATATVNATPAAPVVTPSAATVCLGSIAQLSVNAPGGGVFTSSGGANIPGSGTSTATGAPASVYPIPVTVSGIPTNAILRSVTLNGITHTFPDDLDIVLQSPNGTNVILMSDAGLGDDISNFTYTFDDAASGLMNDNALTPSGTYRPTNFGTGDNWPAPGPGTLNQLAPTLSSITGNPNGTWNLYIVDDAGVDVGSITSWSLNFVTTGVQWTPATGLFTNASATIPYVAGTSISTVYARPTTTTTYNVTATTPTCTSAVTSVTVTVLQPIAITTQPASQTVCQGATVTFSVVATGNSLSYQWQQNTGSGFTNITGANAASLVLNNVPTTSNGYQYRVIITNSCFTVTSSAATLTVNATPAVTATPLTQRICISDTLVALQGTPVGGTWSGVGVSGNNFVPMATAVGSYTLTYTYTNAAGCTNTASVVARVQDCPERLILLRDNAVTVYPNPNNGKFFFRINSALYNYLGLRVYTATGQLVSTSVYAGLVFGRVVPVDLSHLPGGIYMLHFYYDGGTRSSDKTVQILIAR